MRLNIISSVEGVNKGIFCLYVVYISGVVKWNIIRDSVCLNK